MVAFFPIIKLIQYQIRSEIKAVIKNGVPDNELQKIVFEGSAKPD